MQGLLQDVRYTVRLIGRDRWFSAAAIVAMALGIGVNAAGFSIVNGAFLRGVPFAESDRLFVLTWQNREGRRTLLSDADLEQWRGVIHGFQAIAAFTDDEATLSDDRAAPEAVSGAWVTVNAFALTRQRPLLGRDFTDADGRAGAERVVLIGQGLWQRRFGGGSDVVGRPVRVNGTPATIVGVVESGLGSPEGTDVWLPLAPPDSEDTRLERRLHVVGRLADGASADAVRAEVRTVARSLAEAGGERTRGLIGGRMETFTERFVGGVARPVFMAVMGAASFVLVIVCANVASLLLSRSAVRAREVATRMAMGATRWQVVRQLLVESVTLSAAGAALGVVLAKAGTSFMEAALTGTGMPFWIHVTVDGTVMAYVVAICLLTAVAVGLAPALHVSRTNGHELLREGGRGAVGSRRARAFSGAMVVAELACTMVLLVGAGLMIRTFLNLQVVDLGFDTRPLLAMPVRLPESRYAEAADRRAFVDRLQPRLAAIPGVEALAITTGVPPFDGGERLVEIDGGSQRPRFAATVTISPAFFDTLGVRVRRGRGFDGRDGAPGLETAIVNEQFIQEFLGGADPIGRRFRFTVRDPRPGQPPQIWRTVVGVSPDISYGSPEDGYESATVYLPYRQDAPPALSLVVRTALPAASVMDAVRQQVREVDPDQPVLEARTVRQLLDEAQWLTRLFGSLFALFAVIAVVLSAIGLYSVMAHSVTQRTAEIGVRMAVGAAARDIWWLVFRRGFTQLACGLVLGVAGALALSRVLVRALVGVSPADPLTYLAITLLLAAVSVAACLIPARRATRVDPVVALRSS